MRRGKRRDAQVDRDAVDRDARAAVLRAQPIGDVEPRENLDARHERGAERRAEAFARREHAVDAVAHGDSLLFRLDVNVARAARRCRRRAARRRARSRSPRCRSPGNRRRGLGFASQVLDLDGRFGSRRRPSRRRTPRRCASRSPARRRARGGSSSGREPQRSLAVDVERIRGGDEQLVLGRRERQRRESAAPTSRGRGAIGLRRSRGDRSAMGSRKRRRECLDVEGDRRREDGLNVHANRIAAVASRVRHRNAADDAAIASAYGATRLDADNSFLCYLRNRFSRSAASAFPLLSTPGSRIRRARMAVLDDRSEDAPELAAQIDVERPSPAACHAAGDVDPHEVERQQIRSAERRVQLRHRRTTRSGRADARHAHDRLLSDQREVRVRREGPVRRDAAESSERERHEGRRQPPLEMLAWRRRWRRASESRSRAPKRARRDRRAQSAAARRPCSARQRPRRSSTSRGACRRRDARAARRSSRAVSSPDRRRRPGRAPARPALAGRRVAACARTASSVPSSQSDGARVEVERPSQRVQVRDRNGRRERARDRRGANGDGRLPFDGAADGRVEAQNGRRLRSQSGGAHEVWIGVVAREFLRRETVHRHRPFGDVANVAKVARREGANRRPVGARNAELHGRL